MNTIIVNKGITSKKWLGPNLQLEPVMIFEFFLKHELWVQVQPW